jgi:hypothetical protein
MGLVLGSVASGCASSSNSEKTGTDQLAEPVVEVNEANRIVEGRGGFSWVPPAGWEITPFHSSPYKIARAPEVDGFSPNINISHEAFPGSIDIYVAAAKDALTQQFPKIEFLSSESVSQGFEHRRMVTRNTYEEGLTLIQQFYFLPIAERETYFILVCTQREGGEDLTATCDASARSFKAEAIQAEVGWFNVTAPEGWQNMPHANLQYNMWISPTGTSLIFSEEPYQGDLSAYIDLVIQQSGEVSVQSRDSFQSTAGSLTRLLTTNKTESGDIHQRHYYLTVPQRGSVLLAICTEALGASDVGECEQTVSTLKVSAE